MVWNLQFFIYFLGRTTIKVGGLYIRNQDPFEYEGELDLKGKPHGKGRAKDCNGKMYIGLWNHGKRNGPCE